MERVEGDRELLRELLHLYFQEYPKLLAGISLAIDSRQADHVERLAHSLKSALLNLSAKPAADAAYHVERLGRDSRFQEAAASLTLLKKQLEVLHNAMVQYLKTSLP
jgi:two-component system, sensor histidine kinase and response regulator